MQTVPFLPHYQLVYINFDFSSFSLISYPVTEAHLQSKWASVNSQVSLIWNTSEAHLENKQ